MMVKLALTWIILITAFHMDEAKECTCPSKWEFEFPSPFCGKELLALTDNPSCVKEQFYVCNEANQPAKAIDDQNCGEFGDFCDITLGTHCEDEKCCLRNQKSRYCTHTVWHKKDDRTLGHPNQKVPGSNYPKVYKAIFKGCMKYVERSNQEKKAKS